MANDTMQRRHFEVIASIIKTSEITEKERVKLANMFANKLGRYNSKFDADRFVAACLTGKMGKGRSHKDV